MIRIRRGIFPVVPDAVVYPETEEDIQAILHWAEKNSVGVIPRGGGGTSVVGGVEAFRLKPQNGLIVIDLKRMNRILKIHKESLLADVQAGIFGPELEEHLLEKGSPFHIIRNLLNILHLEAGLPHDRPAGNQPNTEKWKTWLKMCV